MEDRYVNISRVGINVSYPCNFMIIASTNPCPCGYYGSKEKKCICTEKQRQNYISKLSGPLIDRFDIQVRVPKINYKEMNSKNIETSCEIRKRVNNARKIQLKRYENEHLYSNSELTPILLDKYCVLSNDAKNALNIAFDKLKMSSRTYSKILKVSRTIADLDNKEKIQLKHVLEAIQYRNMK